MKFNLKNRFAIVRCMKFFHWVLAFRICSLVHYINSCDHQCRLRNTQHLPFSIRRFPQSEHNLENSISDISVLVEGNDLFVWCRNVLLKMSDSPERSLMITEMRIDTSFLFPRTIYQLEKFLSACLGPNAGTG